MHTSATSSYVTQTLSTDVDLENGIHNDDVTSIDKIREHTPNGLPPLMWINGVIGILIIACCCCSVFVIKRIQRKRYNAVHRRKSGQSGSYLFREYDKNEIQNDQSSGQSLPLHEAVEGPEADAESDGDGAIMRNHHKNNKQAVLIGADLRKRTFEQQLESDVVINNLVLDDIIREINTSGASNPARNCNLFSPSSKSAMSNPLSEGRAPLPLQTRSFEDRKYEEEPQENEGLIKNGRGHRKLNDRVGVKMDIFVHGHGQYGDDDIVAYTLKSNDSNRYGFVE